MRFASFATRSTTTSRRLARSLALLAAVAAIGSTAAQEGPRNLLALGVASVPEFEGSADRTAVPFLFGRIDLGSYGSLRLAGAGLQYNVLGDRGAWAFGPSLSYRPARDADVKDPVVQRLREIDATAEAGLFVEYGLRDVLGSGDRLGVGVDVKGNKGGQVGLNANYRAAKIGAFHFGADASVSFANDKYMETYFSVDADNALRSGLPQYSASGGAKSVSLGLTATYDLTREWVLLGRVGFSRLLGDARDSPIVRLRGDENAVLAGVAVGYRF